MALKQNPESPSAGPATGPAWGRLAEKGETAPVVRFVVGDRTVSFPVHAFRRWEFTPGSAETLAIRTDSETVTVQGSGLAAIRDALDAGLLMVLRVKPGRLPSAPPGETVVTGITFTVETE